MDSPADKNQTGPADKNQTGFRGWQKSNLAIVSKNAHDITDNLQFNVVGEVKLPPHVSLPPTLPGVKLVLLASWLEIIHAPQQIN